MISRLYVGTAFGIAMLFSAPASATCGTSKDGAAMCGKSTKAQSSTPVPQTKPARSSKPKAACGCECCKNMAMKDMNGDMKMPGMIK